MVFQYYGSTEVGGYKTRDTCIVPRDTCVQTGSVSWTWDVTSGCLGSLTAGNEAMVRDTATGARLGPGEVGEICVKAGIT